MTELFFVRHGRTAENTAKRFQGHTDTHLDDTGRWQAERLAWRMASYEIDALYSSDLARARQTAEELSHRLGLAAIARRDLREIDVGNAAGLTKDELRRCHPAIFAEGWPAVPFPGGESYLQTSARITTAAREIAARHEGQRVVLVTHGGAIRGAIAGLADIPIPTLAGLVVANTSITCVAVDSEGRGHLRVVNDAAHLESWPDRGLRERDSATGS
jgi:broad specificity phosphatase PhoE